ncbi:MAG TPA: hypothetical protein VFX35_06350 [Solirubrobacterales bacterium]|nr:hypothetical protein [Solirubrobacterales bacterium]
MALKDWELRPADETYYRERTSYVRQGDLFCAIPQGFPWPSEAIAHEEGERTFLSGPFSSGFGMLVTPTCSMLAQGDATGYAHSVRSLAPVIPLAELVERGAVKAGAVQDLRARDHLVNYFYLPAIPDQGLEESLALIYAPVTIHHDYLEDRRVAQLSEEAAVHLKYKLCAMYCGELFSHDDFEDKIS